MEEAIALGWFLDTSPKGIIGPYCACTRDVISLD